MPENNRVFLDYDLGANWFLRDYNPLWQSNRELVRIEAKRLKVLLPKLGKALIMKSNDNGSYHVRFPLAKLTKEEELQVMIHSLSHRGHVYFSVLVNDTTLRASKKSRGKTYEPYLMEIVE